MGLGTGPGRREARRPSTDGWLHGLGVACFLDRAQLPAKRVTLSAACPVTRSAAGAPWTRDAEACDATAP